VSPQVYCRCISLAHKRSRTHYAYVYAYLGSFLFISAIPNERRGARCPTFSVARTRQCIPQVSVNRSLLDISVSQRDPRIRRAEPWRISLRADAPPPYLTRQCFRKRGLFQPTPPPSLAAGASNGKIEIGRLHLGGTHATHRSHLVCCACTRTNICVSSSIMSTVAERRKVKVN